MKIIIRLKQGEHYRDLTSKIEEAMGKNDYFTLSDGYNSYPTDILAKDITVMVEIMEEF
jgi:hypothetical protein